MPLVKGTVANHRNPMAHPKAIAEKFEIGIFL
jgi:hypothetical protein